eukprot:325150_1
MGNDVVHPLSAEHRVEYLVTGYFREAWRSNGNFLIEIIEFLSDKEDTNICNFLPNDLKSTVIRFIGVTIPSSTEIEEWNTYQKQIEKDCAKEKSLNNVSFRLLMMGLDGSGKSTIMNHFRTYSSSKYSNMVMPSFGIDFETLYLTKHNQRDTHVPYVNMSQHYVIVHCIKNMNGCDKWKKYRSDLFGIIWVIDASDSDRLDESKRQLDMILKQNTNYKLLVFLNDRMDATNTITPSLVANQLGMHPTHYHISQTHAIEGDGLYDGMTWLAREYGQQLQACLLM